MLLCIITFAYIEHSILFISSLLCFGIVVMIEMNVLYSGDNYNLAFEMNQFKWCFSSVFFSSPSSSSYLPTYVKPNMLCVCAPQRNFSFILISVLFLLILWFYSHARTIRVVFVNTNKKNTELKDYARITLRSTDSN